MKLIDKNKITFMIILISTMMIIILSTVIELSFSQRLIIFISLIIISFIIIKLYFIVSNKCDKCGFCNNELKLLGLLFSFTTNENMKNICYEIAGSPGGCYNIEKVVKYVEQYIDIFKSPDKTKISLINLNKYLSDNKKTSALMLSLATGIFINDGVKGKIEINQERVTKAIESDIAEYIKNLGDILYIFISNFRCEIHKEIDFKSIIYYE